MRIMSESEYQRCIEAAEKRGYDKARHEAYIERDEQDYRNSMWREIGDLRRNIFERIERLELATGHVCAPTCGCADAVANKPAPF